VDVRPEDGELEQAPAGAHRRVRGGWGIGGHRAEDRHTQVDGKDHDEAGERRDREPPVAHRLEASPGRVDPECCEPCDREARDRHQTLGDACRLEAGDDAPDRLVAGEVRAEREKARDERGEAEHERQPATPADRDEPDDGEDRRQPAEEDELLHARSDRAAHEVGELRGVPVDLRERPARSDRPGDRPAVDGQAGAEGGRRPDARLPPLRPRKPRPHVAEHERDRAQGEVELPGERQRDEACAREHEAAPLERQERGGEEEGDEPEQVTGGLADAVRHQAEDEPAEERGSAREPERAQPPAREDPGRDEREENDQVVGPRVAERGTEGPVGETEQPALEVRRRLRLRTERVRVGERRAAVTELVTDEPEAPAELEVVTRRSLPMTGGGAREVVVVDVPDRRPRRPERTRGVQREGGQHEGTAGGHGRRP
jgi:hypothetical protein